LRNELSQRTRLRVGLVDMNNGVANQAVRSFRSICANFFSRVQAHNPKVECAIEHVQPRNKGELPPEDCDLYLGTGGPDSPVDGFAEPWCTPYRSFLDRLLEEQQAQGDQARAAFMVCYSFEIATLHLKVAHLGPRPRKFGIMPVYPTEVGMGSELFGPFGDRLFAWEHRSWEAVDLDEKLLRSLGGAVYARESRDGVSKGKGLVAFRFAPGIEGTIFHPEADRPGALAWIERPEQAQAVRDTYGEQTYQRMLKTLDDPTRLARTYALLLPGWLARRFNALAVHRGWTAIPEPRYDAFAISAFERPVDRPATGTDP
jgi:homoserine O-succinyltransferase/O-acetyltransferase